MDYKSKWALQKAKTVIETNFPLVGITERIKKTILLMEAVFPQFYTGLSTFEASLKLGGKYCTMYYCRYVPVQF